MRPMVLCLAALSAFAVSDAVGAAPQADQQADQIVQVLPRDAIPAIDHPTFEPVMKAKNFDANELMIGLVGASEQRVYSTWQLDRHEIVNDTFDGRPVAVTWCPLCGTAVVYARTVAGRTLTFGVSGMLYRDALVMYDRETGTLWSHVDGRALQGPLLGSTLEAVPSVHATWRQWKTLYPESVVLEKTGVYRRSAYDDYNRDRSRLGIFGRRLNRSALPPKERILGLRFNGASVAFVVEEVRRAVLVAADVGGVPVVLVAADPDLPVAVFERRVRERVLTFTRAASPEPLLEDTETRSRWRIADGQAIDGPLEGQRLSRAIARPAFWFGWYGFFPDSAVWPASR